MKFEDKIENIRDNFNNVILNRFSNDENLIAINQNRNEEVFKLIRIFFNSYLKKEFDKKVLQEIDIKQSICKYIEEHENTFNGILILKILNRYMKELSIFSLNIKYISYNLEVLKNTISNCEKNINLIDIS